MSRKIIYSVVKVCQMLPDWQHGIGSGGNRCEPATVAALDCTLKIGADAKAGKDPQQIMLDFARWRNNGAISGPGEPLWAGDWLKSHSNSQIFLEPIAATFAAVKQEIDAGRLVFCLVNYYMRLLDYAGNDPYSWKEDPSLPEGHFFLIAGYDDNFKNKYGETAILNDPLQGTLTRQPWDYRFSSLLNAGLHPYAVVAPPLKVTDESPQPVTQPAPPPPPVDTATTLAQWQAYGDAVEKYLLNFPKPPA